MIYYDLEQGTEDWFNMRVGACNSSRLNDALAKLKDPKKESADRRNYKRELAIERLTSKAFEHYVSAPMQFGIENEGRARTEYEFYSGNEVTPIGLAMHPTVKWFMASTDGLVGKDGMIEIKCPNTINHLDILLSGEIPAQYHWQMLGGMACAERQWCDFVSFDPRLPEDLSLFVKRFHRDDALIAGMELEVVQFLTEVEELLAQLKESRAKVLADYAVAVA
jgi:putative phage-type endonuclease